MGGGGAGFDVGGGGAGFDVGGGGVLAGDGLVLDLVKEAVGVGVGAGVV